MSGNRVRIRVFFFTFLFFLETEGIKVNSLGWEVEGKKAFGFYLDLMGQICLAKNMVFGPYRREKERSARSSVNVC